MADTTSSSENGPHNKRPRTFVEDMRALRRLVLFDYIPAEVKQELSLEQLQAIKEAARRYAAEEKERRGWWGRIEMWRADEFKLGMGVFAVFGAIFFCTMAFRHRSIVIVVAMYAAIFLVGILFTVRRAFWVTPDHVRRALRDAGIEFCSHCGYRLYDNGAEQGDVCPECGTPVEK